MVDQTVFEQPVGERLHVGRLLLVVLRLVSTSLASCSAAVGTASSGTAGFWLGLVVTGRSAGTCGLVLGCFSGGFASSGGLVSFGVVEKLDASTVFRNLTLPPPPMT